MIKIENKQLFGKLIADSVKKIDQNGGLQTWEKVRWQNALGKAAARIEDHGEFITYLEDEKKLVIWSPSNEVYEVNKTCQCEAYRHAQPCWHLAAKRLIENYFAALESEQAEPAKTPDAIPYLKPESGKRPEQVGRFRI